MRYFFISYFYKIKDGFGYGNSCIAKDTFPSMDDIELNVKQGTDCEGISVLNIQELNEGDYNNLISKGE